MKPSSARWLILFVLLACYSVDVAIPPQAWLWQQVEAGLPRQSITLAVAVDPFYPNRIWAGQYAPNSLLVSNDGGRTWLTRPVGQTDNPIFDLLLQPKLGDETQLRLWAATRDGLMWSDDSGLSWFSSTDGLPTATAFSLAIDQVGRLYAGLDDHGVFVLPSAEASWQKISLKPPLAEAAVLSLSVSSEGQQIYAGVSSHGIFSSRDYGASWQVDDLVKYGGTVISNPNDPDTAVVASLTDPLAYTQDGGQSWHFLTTLPSQSGGVTSLLWLPDDLLGVGTSRGQFYSTLDGGATWSKGGQGLPSRGGLLDLAVVTQPDGSRQFVAATWNGLYHSSDEGRQWTHFSPTVGDTDPQLLLNVDGAVLLGTQQGLFRWQPTEQSWVALPYEFPSGIGSLVAHPNNPEILYVGTTSDGLYSSDDGGETWVQLPSRSFGIPDLAIDPKNPDHLFLLAAWERVYESHDGGQHWVARWDGLGDVIETVSLAIDPHEPFIYVGTETGLFRGLDNQPWQPMASDLADQSILALLTVSSADSSILYIGGTRGVYRSLDQAESVTDSSWGQGLEQVSVTALLADPLHEEWLYAGTAYRGLYQSVDGGQTWHSIGLEQLVGQVIESLALGQDGQLFVVATDTVWMGRPQ